MQTLEEGISSAAKAVEHSIKHGQPLDLVDTRPVTDLLNEIGSGDLSALDPAISGMPTFSNLQPPSHDCCCTLSPCMSFMLSRLCISVWELQKREMGLSIIA